MPSSAANTQACPAALCQVIPRTLARGRIGRQIGIWSRRVTRRTGSAGDKDVALRINRNGGEYCPVFCCVVSQDPGSTQVCSEACYELVGGSGAFEPEKRATAEGSAGDPWNAPDVGDGVLDPLTASPAT
jgi:hypothetical protein